MSAHDVLPRQRAASSWRAPRRAVPRAEHRPAGARVVAFLASHVSDRRRLQLLRHCLGSIAAQDSHLDALYVSWHAPDALRAEVAAMLAEWSRRLPPGVMRPLPQPERRSQYQHLRACLSAAAAEFCASDAPGAPSWLIFTDDDDLWHPQRVGSVRRACESASSSAADALLFPVYAYPVEDGAENGADEPETAADVDALLRAGRADLWLAPSEVLLQ